MPLLTPAQKAEVGINTGQLSHKGRFLSQDKQNHTKKKNSGRIKMFQISNNYHLGDEK